MSEFCKFVEHGASVEFSTCSDGSIHLMIEKGDGDTASAFMNATAARELAAALVAAADMVEGRG